MMLFGATKNCSIQPLVACVGLGKSSSAMGPLVLIGLGFAVASRAGFFNVGLPGQALAGWILSGWFALSHPDMPCPLMILATIVIALIAGGIVGAIPGILRAYLGTSEVIVTIMMNYIVLYVGNAFIHAFLKISCKVQIRPFVSGLMQPTRPLGWLS